MPVIMFEDGRTVELPKLEVTVAGKPFEVELAKYPDNSLVRVLVYGWTQVLNDAHASEKNPENKFELAMKRNDKLLSGDLTARMGGGRVTDPIMLEALAMATNDVKAEWRGKRKLDADAVAAEAKARVEKYSMYKQIAAETIERRKAMLAATADDAAELVADL